MRNRHKKNLLFTFEKFDKRQFYDILYVGAGDE